MCACHKRAATCSYALLPDGLSATAHRCERLSIEGVSLMTLRRHVFRPVLTLQQRTRLI